MFLLLKNSSKKIIKSLGRYLSILFIIALGISIFMGLRESTAGMLYTADHYYDEHNLMDFKIASTYGFTGGDITSLKELKNVEKVIPSFSVDVLIKGKSVRIHALEKNINNVTLTSGRMPKNKNECLADSTKYKLKDIVTFQRDDINDFLTINKCEIVGLINSVLYIRDEKGISNVGNGKLYSFIFINKKAFTVEYYTDVYLTATNSLDSKSYFDDYDKVIKPLEKELKKLKPIRETIRYEEILEEATKEINSNKKKINDEINKALKELNDNKKKISDGEIELNNSLNTLKKEITDNKQLLLKEKEKIINPLQNNGITEDNLETNIQTLNTTIDKLNTQLEYLDKDSPMYQELDIQIKTLNEQVISLTKAQEGLKNIAENLKKINDEEAINLEKINIEQEKLDSNKKDLEKGYLEVEKNKLKAEKEIQDAKDKLNEIEKPIWYLFDRTYNSGYSNYKEDILKVDSIAKILPVFFILIVMLMTLNTLTRLIEEERTEIGILQSNGFSSSQIIFSYLFYVLTAGFFGISLGFTFGYTLVPQVIYGVFLASFYTPKLITIVSPLPFSLVITITLLLMSIITIYACLKELKYYPAYLMRPKAPKSGKKIFFERFNKIWLKLSFLTKTTIRNLFRYKKRIVMTVLGVAGCTALLIAGLGINDSINTISKLQYEKIIKYDFMGILKEETTNIPSSLKDFLYDNEIVNPLLVSQNAYTFSFNNKTEDVYLIIPSDINTFNNYVSLTNINNNKKIPISNHGAVITKQMASLLNVDIGDQIKIRNSDNELFIMSVDNITNNYVSHYIYISKEYYEEIFNKNIKYNSIIGNGKVKNDSNISDKGLLVINYTDDIISTFDSFISGLNKIIIMIVIFACFLALIVLYNLTIINVNERKREIATFKVLGFYNKEISTFVFRETIILTLAGILFGLRLGFYLHKYIIGTAETDNILFLRHISPFSYLISIVITIFFAIVVQIIINFNLKNIDMIESLKITE